ncbi:MAG: ATP-binding cassette domain-containing protein [Steroidobacteraceae bacterium]
MNAPAIQLEGVEKSYPYFQLHEVEFALQPGEIMGLIGPNGAGKSTILRILMGLVHADRGDIRVLGHSMPARQAAAKWEIGFISEEMRLYGLATLQWHLDFIASIYPAWDAQYAKSLLKRFDLHPQQITKRLSHGQHIKAMLLLALARRPKLLVLDEPMTGLDPVARHEVLGELTAIMQDERRSILFSSHHTQDVEQISDRITFIDRGRVIESTDKETFLDRWRRIHVEMPAGSTLPQLPGVVEVKSSGGRLAIVTTKAFTPALNAAYEHAGGRVQEIQPMTLEEIFVAEVMASRQERPA